jgi:IclR family acetate operon transcriptional repressor
MTTDAEHTADSPSLRAVERVCDILDLLQEAPDGLSLTDIAERTGLPKSTAYRYLVALERRNYVDRDENMMRLGFAFRPRSTRDIEHFLAVARPLLVTLRDETGETVNLGLLDGGHHTHAIVVESEQMMRLAARVGERGMLHSTAIGKVIAARMDPEVVRTILKSEGMPALTSKTITNADDYFAELARVRRAGYGLDDCENQDGGRCIAVPVEGLPVLGGLSISAPVSRFPKKLVPEFAELLQASAAKLSQQYREIAGGSALAPAPA